MEEKNKEGIIREICEEVLRKVTPSEREKEEVLHFSEDLAKKLTEKMQSFGIKAEAQVQGSIAKDTWLTGERDVDMFILLPKTYTKEVFPKVLDVVKTLVGEKWVEAYAEHPYIEAEVDGYRIDFVPCFRVERAEEAISSVDRTPFHTSYVKKRINQQLKNEVRLLKRFMRGIDTYGAEIKIGGFSGYLCELLIINYGSFIEALRAFSDWRGDVVIDLEGFYRREEARSLFREPLVIVDPVDRRRNVASSVREERLKEFIVASKAFLRSPSLKFFYPLETIPYDVERLVKAIRRRGSALTLIKIKAVEAVPDVLWGQLYKTQRALLNVIKGGGFNVLRSCVWSDERSINVFLFEVENRYLTPIKRHVGPPIEKEECEFFLSKYLSSTRTLSGPYLEGGRWIVDVEREYTDVVKLLRDKIKGGGREVGVADLMAKVMPEAQILVNEEILELYSSNVEFAKFLTDYLDGRPKWLR